MDLTELIARRSRKEPLTLPIPDQELRDRYDKVYSAAVNDVLREMGYLYQTLPTNICALRDGMRLCGFAFTVKGSKNLTIENEMEQRAEMLEAFSEASICVWDTSNDDESAQWGEVMTMASQRRGCVGAVIDGGIRDVDRLINLNFPIFYRYRTSSGMLGRFRIIGYQIPVMIGAVMIEPGDVILGDMDGVIVVPRAIAYEVLLKAEKIVENEREIKQMIIDGLSPRKVVENGGYF